MQKLVENTTGDFKCTLYKYTLGYGFKIFYLKKTKGNLVAQSYVYYHHKQDAIDAMHDRLHTLIGISQDLFDFGKL